jgi:hypothetical protein
MKIGALLPNLLLIDHETNHVNNTLPATVLPFCSLDGITLAQLLPLVASILHLYCPTCH